MTKLLNINKLVAVSLLAIFVIAGAAMAAGPSTGVTCGEYEVRGQYVSVPPHMYSESQATNNMSDADTITSSGDAEASGPKTGVTCDLSDPYFRENYPVQMRGYHY